jgi:GxxExxY protein
VTEISVSGISVPENDIAREIVDAAYKVHTTLGPGLLESVYQSVLTYELERRGLRVQCEVPISIRYDNLRFEIGFRADLLVNDVVIVELKSVEQEAPVHRKQVLTYIRLANLRLGLLLNFGARRIKDGITRRVNGLPE